MKHRFLLVIVASIVLLVGCKNSDTVNLSKVTESTIGVNADGSIDEVTIESFDKEYYSLKDLKEYIYEQVDAFNIANPMGFSSDGEELLAITVVSVEVDSSDNTARLEMLYSDCDFYSEFNGVNLQFMDVTTAGNKGIFTDEIDLIAVKGSSSVSYDDFKSKTELHVICVDTAAIIKTSGKILYYSSYDNLINNTTIETTDGLSIIVFK